MESDAANINSAKALREAVPPRTLADILAENGLEFQIKLVLSPTTASMIDECPFPLEEATAEDHRSTGDAKVYFLKFNKEFREEDEEEMLEWFSKLTKLALSDIKARQETPGYKDTMVFPLSFTKEQRAHWHQLADKAGLTSQSEGFGKDRFLTMTLAEAAPRVQQGSARQTHLSGPRGAQAQRAQAKRIFDWCQAEGGAYLNYSHSEILQLVTTANVMPPDLARLCGKREMGKRLVEKIQARDSKASLSLLSRDPSLAWLRDTESGGYPLHIAAWQGLEPVVASIIEQKTTLEQKDGQQKTPLQVAQRRRQTAVVKLLLDAGAVDSGPPPEEEPVKSLSWKEAGSSIQPDNPEEQRRKWNSAFSDLESAKDSSQVATPTSPPTRMPLPERKPPTSESGLRINSADGQPRRTDSSPQLADPAAYRPGSWSQTGGSRKGQQQENKGSLADLEVKVFTKGQEIDLAAALKSSPVLCFCHKGQEYSITRAEVLVMEKLKAVAEGLHSATAALSRNTTGMRILIEEATKILQSGASSSGPDILTAVPPPDLGVGYKPFANPDGTLRTVADLTKRETAGAAVQIEEQEYVFPVLKPMKKKQTSQALEPASKGPESAAGKSFASAGVPEDLLEMLTKEPPTEAFPRNAAKPNRADSTTERGTQQDFNAADRQNVGVLPAVGSLVEEATISMKDESKASALTAKIYQPTEQPKEEVTAAEKSAGSDIQWPASAAATKTHHPNETAGKSEQSSHLEGVVTETNTGSKTIATPSAAVVIVEASQAKPSKAKEAFMIDPQDLASVKEADNGSSDVETKHETEEEPTKVSAGIYDAIDGPDTKPAAKCPPKCSTTSTQPTTQQVPQVQRRDECPADSVETDAVACAPEKEIVAPASGAAPM